MAHPKPVKSSKKKVRKSTVKPPAKVVRSKSVRSKPAKPRAKIARAAKPLTSSDAASPPINGSAPKVDGERAKLADAASPPINGSAPKVDGERAKLADAKDWVQFVIYVDPETRKAIGVKAAELSITRKGLILRALAAIGVPIRETAP